MSAEPIDNAVSSISECKSENCEEETVNTSTINIETESSKDYSSLPNLMFSGIASSKAEIKSAHFEFGNKPISSGDIYSGFDSADSTNDSDFLGTQEAVQSAILLMDKGLQNDSDQNIDSSANTVTPSMSENNEINLSTSHGNIKERNTVRDQEKSKNTSIQSKTEFSNTNHGHFDSSAHLKSDCSGTNQILSESVATNLSEEKFDQIICSQENKLSKQQEENCSDIDTKIISNSSKESGLKNSFNTENAEMDCNDKLGSLDNTDNDSNYQTTIDQSIDIPLSKEQNFLKEASCLELEGDTGNNEEGNESRFRDVQNESTSKLSLSFDTCSKKSGSMNNDTTFEGIIKSNRVQRLSILESTDSVGNDEEQHLIESIKETSKVADEFSKITFSDDKRSEGEIIVKSDSSCSNSKSAIGETLDEDSIAVTLENVEVSVFDKGLTDDFSTKFLKYLSKDVKESSNKNHRSVSSFSQNEFKLDDAILSSDEDIDRTEIEFNSKESQEVLSSKNQVEINLDETVTNSEEENSRNEIESNSNGTYINFSKPEEETMEVEENRCSEEELEKSKQDMTNIGVDNEDFDDCNMLPSESGSSKSFDTNENQLDDNEIQEENDEIDNTDTPRVLPPTEESKESDDDMVSSKGLDRENQNNSRASSKQGSEVEYTDPTDKITDISEADSNDVPCATDITYLMQKALAKNEEFRKNLSPDLVCLNSDSNAEISSKETEVICLEDDDDYDLINRKKKPTAAINCVNPNCMSGEDLDRPAMFVLTYFGLKRAKDQKVCAECFNEVLDHQEKLALMLKEEKPLFSADFPTHKDVILLDSDEEEFSDNESNLSDDTMSMIRDNLDDIIVETLAKYEIDHQIRESCDILDKKIENLEEEAKEMTKRFDEVQNTLDKFRKQIYEDFQPNYQDTGELHFTDCEIPSMPIIKSKLQNHLYNKELMNMLRKEKIQKEKEIDRQNSTPIRTIATKKVSQASQSSTSSDNVAQDVIALHSQSRYDPPPNLPPVGPLIRNKLRVGDLAYTMKVSYFSIWVLCRVVEVIPRNQTENDPSTETYRIRLENVKKNTVRAVTGKYLAYPTPANVQVKVGTRVIAIFKEEDEGLNSKDNYYVGVIAEPPKSTNKYRYLVFFDDGYTQYCPHENILVVCSTSKNVWDDIHPEPRDFIKNYLQQYPERPMVKLSRGQVVKVEWNGRWWIVRVLEVDASLVKVHFDADKRTEWIYRGSTRLGPMYQELAAAKERQSRSLLRSRGFGSASTHKSDMPYVEYTRGDGEEKKDDEKEKSETGEEQPAIPPRSVARKSTAKKPAEVVSNIPFTKPLVDHVPQGTVTQRTLKNVCKSIRFRPHQCNKSCVSWTDYSIAAGKKYDPLVKPLVFGFARLTVTFRGKQTILYRAPCGRMIRSQQEMLCYLQGTKSLLTIDLFDFDFWVNPLNVFEEANSFGRIEDLSYGKENVPISCVNELDHSMPQYVQYMTARQPANDVNLNLDPDFLVGCDCEDDCEDRSKCSCWQLTMQGKAYIPDGDLDPLFGYQYRRLPERIATGIYECNSRCKCSVTCQNRVAQQPLSCRLQLFKTPKKGWGIRCLHDIPRGAFICIYAGFLLTEQEANEGGKTYGDEYLAELDYIESVENLKEGYESEVKNPSDLDDDDEDDNTSSQIEYEQERHSNESDGDFEDSDRYSHRQEDIRLRLRRRVVDDTDKESRKSKTDDDTISISDEEADTSGLCGGCRRSLDNNKDTIKCQACMKTFHIKCSPLQTSENAQLLGTRKQAWICPKCDALVRKPQMFNANIMENEERESRFPSVRDLYGKDENVYIMDAKTHGNIGRYLNHSCSPNVFVQNVFVDTHDLRFPWVAFFANQYIAAGTELTWDYNYDVGSVPGKIMFCYCASSNCRGRLL